MRQKLRQVLRELQLPQNLLLLLQRLRQQVKLPQGQQLPKLPQDLQQLDGHSLLSHHVKSIVAMDYAVTTTIPTVARSIVVRQTILVVVEQMRVVNSLNTYAATTVDVARMGPYVVELSK